MARNEPTNALRLAGNLSRSTGNEIRLFHEYALDCGAEIMWSCHRSATADEF